MLAPARAESCPTVRRRQRPRRAGSACARCKVGISRTRICLMTPSGLTGATRVIGGSSPTTSSSPPFDVRSDKRRYLRAQARPDHHSTSHHPAPHRSPPDTRVPQPARRRLTAPRNLLNTRQAVKPFPTQAFAPPTHTELSPPIAMSFALRSHSEQTSPPDMSPFLP